MSSIIKCDKLLKIYTNKNKDIFESAGNNAYFNLNEGQFGIIYDDYNTDIEVLRKWKADYPKMTIYNVARLRKTIKIDDKIYFSKKMSESLYTPVCYFSKLFGFFHTKYFGRTIKCSKKLFCSLWGK